MKRLHIVGCHRSGTTLLQTLVTTCFARRRLLAGRARAVAGPRGRARGRAAARRALRQQEAARRAAARTRARARPGPVGALRRARPARGDREPRRGRRRALVRRARDLARVRASGGAPGRPRALPGAALRGPGRRPRTRAQRGLDAPAAPFLEPRRPFASYERFAASRRPTRCARCGGLAPIDRDRIDRLARVPAARGGRARALPRRRRRAERGPRATRLRARRRAGPSAARGVDARAPRQRTPEPRGRPGSGSTAACATGRRVRGRWRAIAARPPVAR